MYIKFHTLNFTSMNANFSLSGFSLSNLSLLSVVSAFQIVDASRTSNKRAGDKFPAVWKVLLSKIYGMCRKTWIQTKGTRQQICFFALIIRFHTRARTHLAYIECFFKYVSPRIKIIYHTFIAHFDYKDSIFKARCKCIDYNSLRYYRWLFLPRFPL